MNMKNTKIKKTKIKQLELKLAIALMLKGLILFLILFQQLPLPYSVLHSCVYDCNVVVGSLHFTGYFLLPENLRCKQFISYLPKDCFSYYQKLCRMRPKYLTQFLLPLVYASFHSLSHWY